MAVRRWRWLIVMGAALGVAPGVARPDGLATGGAHGLLSPLGEYVLVGGGVTQFSDKGVRDRLDTGGAWDARVGVGSRSFVGAEVAYVGSYRSGVGANPDVLGNGAEGVLRLQLPYEARGWLVEPFVFGGVGWTRFSLQSAPAGAAGDDVGTIPFGGGLMLGRGRALLDVRFTWRSTFDENLVLAANQPVRDLDHWSVGAAVGFEF